MMVTEQGYTVPDYLGAVSPEFFSCAKKAYEDYKADKEVLKNNIIDNYRWYKRQHGLKFDMEKNEPNASTEYIFNAIENKYADAVDNYPEVSVLEREASDENAALILSKILPVQLEISDFKKAYKQNWRKKMKSGTGIYFIDYDRDLEQIMINSVNVLSFFADVNVSDIQKSQFVFVTSVLDNEELKVRYPEFAALFDGDCTLETTEGSKVLKNRTEIIDCYYKKHKKVMGKIKTSVHLMKIARDVIIDATEDIPGYEDGLYFHGKYPFVLDVMFPNEDSPFGFGVIDVVKGIQEYIDKVDSAVFKNTLIASKTRYAVKDSAGINIEDVANLDKDIFTFAGGNLSDIIKEFKTEGLPASVIEYRDRKINELKEVIGNRDFQQGGTAGGVTSGSAVELLQRSGEKLSRASNDDSYDAYRELCIMVIELMRQFFDRERVYRVTGDDGKREFISFSNSMFKDGLGFMDDSKSSLFDVSVTPQKSNPYTKQGTNATMTQLWQLGVFNPQNLESSIILIRNMQFEGKEKLLQDLQGKLDEVKMQQQQMQQQQMQQQQMQQQEMVALPM